MLQHSWDSKTGSLPLGKRVPRVPGMSGGVLSSWGAPVPRGARRGTTLSPLKRFPRKSSHLEPDSSPQPGLCWGSPIPTAVPQPRPRSVPARLWSPLAAPPSPGSHPEPNPPGPDSDVSGALGSGGSARDASGPGEALTLARPFSLCPVPRLLLLVCFVSGN